MQILKLLIGSYVQALIQVKLKAFCSRSLVLAIYHADTGGGSGETNQAESQRVCVNSGDFFDANLHFEGGSASVMDVC